MCSLPLQPKLKKISITWCSLNYPDGVAVTVGALTQWFKEWELFQPRFVMARCIPFGFSVVDTDDVFILPIHSSAMSSEEIKLKLVDTLKR
jgi:hypothetical protein